MATKGKRLTYLIISLGLLVLVVAGVALKDRAIEQWYLWKLESEDEEDRKAAAEQLGDMGSLRAIPLLKQRFRKEPGTVALNKLSYSGKALVMIGSPAIPVFVEGLKDESVFVRLLSAYALGENSTLTEEAILALAGALKDEDKFVRQEVFFTLRRIGPAAKAAVPALRELLNDKSNSIRRFAAGTLERIESE